MADLKKTVEILFEGNDQASRKAADVIGKVREMEAAAKTSAGETQKLGESLDTIGTKSAAVDAVVASLKALAAGLVVDRFVAVNVEAEKFDRALKALKGSSFDVAREWQFVSDTANRLGLSVVDAADAYVKLFAATSGTALEGEKTRQIFEAVSKAMSALGRSSADTEGALLAISQIVSKGTVSLEELRGQLGERLPGAFQIAAKSMGLTTQELDKLVSSGKLSAEEFLPRFAQELERTFGAASFDGYVQSLNRLRNTIDEALIAAGKAGAFDALIAGINAVTAIITGAISSVKLFGEIIGAFLALLKSSGDAQYGIFGADWAGFRENVTDAVDSAASSTKSLLDAFTKTSDAGAKAGADIAKGMEGAKAPTDAAAKSTAELDALLKKLGVDPKKTSEGIAQIAADLEALAKNPKSNGEQFALAFESAIKKVTTVEGLKTLQQTLLTAFDTGKISAAQLEVGLGSLDKAFDKITGTTSKAKSATDEAAKAMQRQAEEARKAEEQAQKFRLEMEKLASNERIKNIEARVTLNVAQLEADTKRVEAAFESINTTVNSSGELLSDLFGLLKDYDSLSFGALRLIEKQIQSENDNRRQALDQQRKLVEAQVRQLEAQTRALEKGESVIKVDGAGLQPHLEAFMWEILRTIQVRTNQEGLNFLLGV